MKRETIIILVVEDEPDVAEAIARDLAPLENAFPVEVAESAESARTLVAQVVGRGDRIGLILCDHVLPGKQGVDFLIELDHEDATRMTRKVLITGQAGLEATVEAVNRAHLAHYIAKPWDAADLRSVCTSQLTDYVLDVGLDPLNFLAVLDAGRLAEALRQRQPGDS